MGDIDRMMITLMATKIYVGSTPSFLGGMAVLFAAGFLGFVWCWINRRMS